MSIQPDVQAALKRARQQIWDAHHRDPNFTGCGIGFRRRAGVRTDEPVVIAMVTDKIPAGALSRRRLLPQTVAIDGVGYGVDVVEAGPVFASGGTAQPAALATTGPITGKFTPPIQGIGISNINADTSQEGTLGCFVIDNTDQTICFLSANHVMARLNNAAVGEVITQPATVDGGGSADGIAKLKRFVPLDPSSSTTNTLDAALAQLDDQSPSSVDINFADNLMPLIDPSHPAVGMCVASDSWGNAFLSRMDTTVDAMNVMLIMAAQGVPCTVAPDVGMNIEKVGRTTGYSASKVDATAVSVNINFNGTAIVMSDMIWSQFFHLDGDSGAVACQGGQGRTFVVPPSTSGAGSCPLLSGIQNYYGLPTATADNVLTNQIQTQFLSQTLTGNLIIGLVYMNAKTVINRLAADTGDSYNQATAQAFVQELYAKYRPLIVNALANPDSTTNVVSEANMYDYAYLAAMLANPPSQGGQGILTYDEGQLAAGLIFIIAYMVGMDYQQVLAFMNGPATYNALYNAFASVPTLEMP